MAKAKLVPIPQPIVNSVELTLTFEEAQMLKGVLGCFIASGATHGVWQALRDAGIDSTHGIVKYGSKRQVGTLDALEYADIEY